MTGREHFGVGQNGILNGPLNMLAVLPKQTAPPGWGLYIGYRALFVKGFIRDKTGIPHKYLITSQAFSI